MRASVTSAILAIAISFFFHSVAARATEVPPDEVRIFGNRIYDTPSILKVAGITENEPIKEDEVKKRLVASGWFSRVRTTRAGHVLRVYVREKEPDFALPYFSSSSDRKRFGVAAGLLGMGAGATELLARYQLGTGDHEGSVYYLNEYLGSTDARITATLDYESALHDEYFGGRDVVRSFWNWQVNGAFGFGYHITPSALAEFDTHLELHHFGNTYGTETRGTQVSHRVFGNLGAFLLNEGIANGGHVKPYVEFTEPASTFSFLQWGVFAEYSVLRSGNFNWIARGSLEQGNDLPRYQLFELGGTKLRGYPAQSFRSDHYLLSQNDFYLFAFPLFATVILRPFAFADWAYVEKGGRPGLGLGLRAFFRNVAVPAVELAAGYGTHPEGISVAASIGPSF
jgi:hypothetical protein